MSMATIEDLVKRLAGGLPGAVGGVRADIEAHFRAVLQQRLNDLGVVSQEEFRIQAKLLERTRAQVAELEARVAALEQAQPRP